MFFRTYLPLSVAVSAVLFACGGAGERAPGSTSAAVGKAEPSESSATTEEKPGPSTEPTAEPTGSDEPAHCDGRPECDEGDTKYASASECGAKTCYSREACGETVWCRTP
jgi:hypothetical protein